MTNVEEPLPRENQSPPFFTIGVTTYRRPERLRNLLEMIRKQTYSDFEVIVGNDCIEETVTARQFGLENDPRFHFVNHPRNLGELENMNALLELAQARYFTWQFDDDGYNFHFLEFVRQAVLKYDYPLCVVPMARHLVLQSIPGDLCRLKPLPEHIQQFEGPEFLRKLRSGEFQTMGYNCVFDTEYLKAQGGVRRLSPCPYALLYEFVLLIRMGLLDRVAVISSPLVFYLAHEGSWSEQNDDVPLLMEAGRNFIRESIKVLVHPAIRDEFSENLFYCLNILIHGVLAPKLDSRSLWRTLLEVNRYIRSLDDELKQLRKSGQYGGLEMNLGKYRFLASLKILSRYLLPKKWLMRHIGWQIET